MTDSEQSQTALLEALKAQLAAMQQSQQPALSGWQHQPAKPQEITGVSVPVKAQTPAGSIRIYLHLPAECAASPAALMAALESLAAAGVPLDTWQPSNSGSGGSWGGSNKGNWRR